MKTLAYIVAVALTLVSCQAQQKGQNVQVVPPVEFEQIITETEGQLLDVRTPKEYKSGHIEGAVNMHIYDKDFEQRANELKKDEPVYLYCKAGSRSAEAVEILKNKGFINIVELEGGMDAWNETGKPVKQ